MPDSKIAKIRMQYEELRQSYPALALSEAADGSATISGDLRFSASYGGKTIASSLPICMSVPSDFPATPPKVSDHLRQIPKDFEHVNPDGSFCLGTPLDVQMKLTRNPTLLGFVNDLVVPFLFSFRFWQETGKMPFGERAHGVAGIYQHYLELFRVRTFEACMSLLVILAKGEWASERRCPCGSQLAVKACHGTALIRLSAFRSQCDFMRDAGEIMMARFKTS